MFTDAATFHNNGHVNRHNLHFYADWPYDRWCVNALNTTGAAAATLSSHGSGGGQSVSQSVSLHHQLV
nr:unnamed protein product [Callosobruchus chinensis]